MIILRSREFLNILTTGSFDWEKFRADNDLNDAI